MNKPMVRISDGVDFVDREMTDDEYAQHLVDVTAEKDRVKSENAKADAKAALLAKLGITADEAALLLA
jgi:hypothetical protein